MRRVQQQVVYTEESGEYSAASINDKRLEGESVFGIASLKRSSVAS